MLVAQGAVVRVNQDFELKKGQLIDDGTLIAKTIKVSDGKVRSTGKLQATTLAVVMPAEAVSMVMITERIEEENGDHWWSLKKEISVTKTEIAEINVAAYKVKKQKEISTYNHPLWQSIRFEKKQIDQDVVEITEYVEEFKNPGLQRLNVLSTATKRINSLESFQYQEQRREDISAINAAAFRNRKPRTIIFTESKINDVALTGDTKVSTAILNVRSISIQKALFDQGMFTGSEIILGSNSIGSLNVTADTVFIADKASLQVTDAVFNISKSMQSGSGSEIRGIDNTTIAAKKVAVSLSSTASFINKGHVVGETVNIEGTSSTLRGTVNNSGKIHAGALLLNNLESIKKQNSSSEICATTAHINNVKIESTDGKIAFNRLESFNHSSTNALMIIAKPYTAKPGEDLSHFKFLSTLTIDGGNESFSLENVEATHIKLKGSNIKIGANIRTKYLEITSTNTIFFEAGVTFDQIGQIIISSENISVCGKINIANLTATINQFVVEVGASLTCHHLYLIPRTAGAFLKNKGDAVFVVKVFLFFF